MSEIATGDERLSAHEALQEIGRIERIHGALERRMSGITWFIWGLAVAGIFVTYDYAGVVADVHAPDMVWLFPVLWVPWVVMGAVSTALLWRSVGLVLPMEFDARAEAREGFLIGALFTVLMLGGFFLVERMDLPIREPAFALAILGVITAIMAFAGLTCKAPEDKRVAAVAGLGLVVVAIAATVALSRADVGIQYAWLSLITPLASAVAYFAVGGILIARG